MRSKLQIVVLILSLALMAAYVNTTNLPNQQIVVQLSNSENSIHESELAIEKIKSSLNISGAEQIAIEKLENGHLKITYFSNSEIYEIQRQLSENVDFTFGIINDKPSSELPNDNDGKYHLLQISELSPDKNTDWGFDSIEVHISKLKGDRFTNVKQKTIGGIVCISKLLSLSGSNPISTESLTRLPKPNDYCIPEVRAGPLNIFA